MSKPLLITNIESRTLRAGDSMTGSLFLKGDPTQSLEAATKQYVDGSVPNLVPSATQLQNSRNFSIADNDGTNIGPAASFNGTANTIINLPATIKASLNGNATTSSSCTGNAATATTAASCSGNSATATKLATARTISLKGGVTGSGSFDGSGNLTITTKGSYASAQLRGNASGYHKININSANSWMTAFTIRVYQYYKWSDIVISGYNYGNNYWYSPSAVLMGSSTGDSITVSFGYDSAYNLWVAIPANLYYGIDIIDVCNGYEAFDSYADLFTITNVSSLTGTVQTTVTAQRPWYRGESITGAVWNDYAECREADTVEPGYVLIENGDDTLSKSTERLQPFAGVSSDTWGFSQGETEKAKTPIAVAGRVLVYPYEDRNSYQPGDCVCAAADGKVSKMTREEVALYPDRIVGTVSCVPTYEKWGGGEMADRDPVDVNGRIWIKVR